MLNAKFLSRYSNRNNGNKIAAFCCFFCKFIFQQKNTLPMQPLELEALLSIFNVLFVVYGLNLKPFTYFKQYVSKHFCGFHALSGF